VESTYVTHGHAIRIFPSNLLALGLPFLKRMFFFVLEFHCPRLLGDHEHDDAPRFVARSPLSRNVLTHFSRRSLALAERRRRDTRILDGHSLLSHNQQQSPCVTAIALSTRYVSTLRHEEVVLIYLKVIVKIVNFMRIYVSRKCYCALMLLWQILRLE